MMSSLESIGFVYLLEAKKIHLLKLGFSANVNQRVATLVHCVPSDVSLVGAFRTRFASESCLHAFFDDLRFHGEWFLDHRSIRKLVLDIQKSTSPSSKPIPPRFFRRLVEDPRHVAILDETRRGLLRSTPQEWATTTKLLMKYKVQIR